ncbi:MAG: Uncharacterised protein [Formosa sp. Hel1_33_131]|nr:MAG: Uncharacterised protein [Formosa sp. Hel1_33_131]|tara:strand:- start:5946 stop:6488 length:543 start_codon:yes stop_codon:yes gene_type:complete
MEEYQKNLEQFRDDLSKLSNQTIIDLKGILLNKIVTYEFNRNESGVVAYLFEYDFELLGLTFYGLDKYLSQYTEHIALPTKFPDDNWKNITQESIYHFESKKTMKRYDEDCNKQEIKLFDEYFVKKYNIFKNWFFICWKKATKGIELKKGAYFSMHDTNYLTELKTMKEIEYDEVKEKHK